MLVRFCVQCAEQYQATPEIVGKSVRCSCCGVVQVLAAGPTHSPANETAPPVIETKEGQKTLTAEEFRDGFGWHNDPSRVIVTAP